MQYRYGFDPAMVPFLRVGRGGNALAKKGLYLLRSEVHSWNERALSNGALSAPFAREAEDIDLIINHLTAQETVDSGVITGLPIGAIRYIKAGIVLLSARKEEEISAKASEGWPEAVIESMREGLKQLNFLAGIIDVEPASILNEIVVGLERRRSLDALEESRPLRVFLCHSSGDKPIVRELSRRLRDDHIDAWFDEDKLLPGQDWKHEISRSLRTSDAVLICLSRASVTKAGYVQRELKDALDLADEQPEGMVFLIPVRLEACEVPDRIRRWQWVDYFEQDGYIKLKDALRLRSAQLEGNVASPAAEVEAGLDRRGVPRRIAEDLTKKLRRDLGE